MLKMNYIHIAGTINLLDGRGSKDSFRLFRPFAQHELFEVLVNVLLRKLIYILYVE